MFKALSVKSVNGSNGGQTVNTLSKNRFGNASVIEDKPLSRLARQYPDPECNGVFMYSVSSGLDERVYLQKKSRILLHLFFITIMLENTYRLSANLPLLYGYDLQQALCLRTVILPKITAQNHMRPVRAKVHCRRLQDLCVAASVFIATQPLRLRGFRFVQPLWKRCGGRLLRTLTFYKLAGTADAAYFFYCDCFFCTMALYRFFVQPLNSFHSSDK